MRGNALSQAAKCIVLMVKLGKKVTKYVLGVVPGDARVDSTSTRRAWIARWPWRRVITWRWPSRASNGSPHLG